MRTSMFILFVFFQYGFHLTRRLFGKVAIITYLFGRCLQVRPVLSTISLRPEVQAGMEIFVEKGGSGYMVG